MGRKKRKKKVSPAAGEVKAPTAEVTHTDEQEALTAGLTKRVTVRLSERDYALVENIARVEGLKPSQVIRALVMKYLRRVYKQGLTKFVR